MPSLPILRRFSLDWVGARVYGVCMAKQLGPEWVDQSVATGSLLSDYLATKFVEVLREVDPQNGIVRAYDEVMGAFWTLRRAGVALINMDMLAEWFDDIVEDLCDELDRVAPEGTSFGTHPGDGSDFGFWTVEDDA